MKNDLHSTISQIVDSSRLRFNRKRILLSSALTGLGVPIGWFVLKSITYEDFSIRTEFDYYWPLYVYLSIYSPLIIYIIGRVYTKYITKYEFLSLHDPLTKIYNRRYLNQQLEEMVEISERYNTEFSVILTDIDHFKKVNDDHGHDCGDFILKELSQLLIKNIRKIDFVGRYGGEEFLVILPQTSVEKARKVADNLRLITEKHRFEYQGKHIPITFSAGVSSHQKEATIEMTIKHADENLYKAKENGRNQIV